MEKNSFAIFLPVRKGSQRIINKNTRRFAEFSDGLLELKLNQLINVNEANEIIVSTNDPDCERITQLFIALSDKIKLDKRPDHLGADTTSLSDLVAYAATLTKQKHIVWTHVTSPFFDSDDYANAIKQYINAIKKGYDSLMSVVPFKSFLWSKEYGDIINRQNQERWPRTQDLQELFEIDSSVFIASVDVYLQNNDRVGSRPFLFINDKIKSFDIDWEQDFQVAEVIYDRLIKRTLQKESK